MLIAGHEDVSNAINAIQVGLAIVLIAVAVAILFSRWRRSDANRRHALSPVIFTGGFAS